MFREVNGGEKSIAYYHWLKKLNKYANFSQIYPNFLAISNKNPIRVLHQTDLKCFIENNQPTTAEKNQENKQSRGDYISI